MPPLLYSEDPRVLTVIAAVRALESGAGSWRPPMSPAAGPPLDIAALASSHPMEMHAAGVSLVVDLPWDIVER